MASLLWASPSIITGTYSLDQFATLPLAILLLPFAILLFLVAGASETWDYLLFIAVVVFWILSYFDCYRLLHALTREKAEPCVP